MIQQIIEIFSVNGAAVVCGMFLNIFGLFIAIALDAYADKKSKRILISIFIFLASLVFQNILEDMLASQADYSPLRIYVSAYGYIIRPLILALFIFIVDYRLHFVVVAIIFFNTVIYGISTFTGIAFSIDNSNHFVGGPLRYCCLISSMFLVLYLFIVSLKKYRPKHKSDIVLLVFSAVIIVLGTYLDSCVGSQRQMVTFLTISMLISSMMYYRWMNVQFVHKHESDFAAQQRIKIMMTQIQPHFLYNTLSTIQALCLTNPEEAYEITGKFGKYLRQNIDSLEEPELITFDKELEHTKIYTEIEKVRFPDINVIYNIEDCEFSLPALTVQPIVENSIRHGIRNVENGTVTITVKKQSGCHTITVADNGKGFDVDSARKSGTHIGIKNVKERVEKMCGGNLTVDSEIGKGTTTTIKIPDEKGE